MEKLPKEKVNKDWKEMSAKADVYIINRERRICDAALLNKKESSTGNDKKEKPKD
jgi:hypothetical protein